MVNNSDLNIDLSILENTGENTSSLEDVSGYKIFSDEWDEKSKKNKKEENNKIDKILFNVLNNKQANKIEISYRNVMNADQATIVKKDYVNKDMSSNLTINASILIMTMLVVGFALFGVEKIWNKIKRK